MTLKTRARKFWSLVATLGLLWVLGGSLQASPVIYEPFDYDTIPDVIEDLSGQNGGVGFSGPWSSTKRDGRILEENNTWGFLPVTGGRAASYMRSAPHRSLDSSLADAGLLENGATLWFSYVEDILGQNMTNLEFKFALTTDSFEGDYYNRHDLRNNGWGIGVSSSQTHIRGAYWLDDGDGDGFGERTESGIVMQLDSNANFRALFVGKIEWGATDTDAEKLTLYAPGQDLALGDPILSAWETPPLDQSQFDTLAIQWKDSEVTIDEIRFAATYDDVLGNPPSLVLQVNPFTGAMSMFAQPGREFIINYYEIASEAGSLDHANWNSLADQDFEGGGPPSGTGDGWEEGGGVNSKGLAEGYLLGDSVISSAMRVDLGMAYDETVNAKDLVFRYRTAEAHILVGEVQYDLFDPDIDGDGSVDAVDLHLLLSDYHEPTESEADGLAPYSPDELEILLGSYGWTTSAVAATDVPEPGASILLLLGIIGLAGLRRR